MSYDDGVFQKFDEAVNDVTINDTDPTLLFIATDGHRVYKAFTGPQSAVGQDGPIFSKGFDEDIYIGIWSHQWLRDMVARIEDNEDPDADWGEMMETMVLSIAEYADEESPPAAGSC